METPQQRWKDFLAEQVFLEKFLDVRMETPKEACE